MGNDLIEITHLQYADDTLFVGEATQQNIHALKCILRLFELISGLKVNFSKSCLVGINVGDEWLSQMENYFHCKAGNLPFKYLVLPVGADPRRISTWQSVVESFQKKLCSWRAKTLSFGARIVQIKSVLSSLPTYIFSLFKAPKKVILKLTSLQRNFLWGGVSDERKTSWISWEKICREKSRGGLGIKKLEEFNMAFLGKWKWGILKENGKLWQRVVKSRYGHVGQGGESGNRQGDFSIGSIWWRDLGKLESFRQGIGNWFSEGMERIVGDGENTSFWHDLWINDVPLSVKDIRLFKISTGKQLSVQQLGKWDGDTWEWNFPWRRRFFTWEQQLYDNLAAEFQPFQPRRMVQDSWRWKNSKDGIYSVKTTYKQLVSETTSTDRTIYNMIWKNLVPLKVARFNWKLLECRLPKKTNLRAINIPTGGSTLCPMCGK